MDRWTVDDVIEWLKTNGLGRYANTFRDEDVDGAALFGLQEKEILKLLSTVNEDGTRKSPTLRIQRKFRTILEEYRTAARQKRRKMRRSDSLFPPSEDFDSYKKVYVLEPTNGSLKFFENDIISSYLIKYFSSTYRVKCLIPKQDPYETNSPLHITLTGNKANVKTVQNELQTILKTIQTKIFNDEIADKKIIRWSKHIYSDSALTILQKLFLNKKKLTIWEKTSVLSGYYIVHYLVGQHSFCSNEDFIRQTVQNELSYSKDLLISDMNKMQINFRKEFDEYLKTKKQQQQKYQTMAIIYCQYPSQTEMNISLFGLKDQIIIAKKQLKNLLHKHRIKTIRIGLTSNQREYILDSCIHQLKTIEFNHKDDHVKLKIREDLIDAPQYLIIKMKQSVLSMIYQRTTIRFQHIEKAIVLTEDHCVQLKTLAQNYNCEIEKIEIDTQNELISLPKGKIVSTSKYILQQSNQFYSSISISKIISIGKNTIELHQSYDLPIDLTVLSTTTDAIRENIDPNQGNGYYGSDTGQKFLYIQWFLPDNQLNASIEKFLSACLSQIEKFSKTTNQTIAFSTTQWKRNVSVNEFIEELKYQFESEQFANYSWKILFIIEKEQKDLYNEFSQSISTFQSNSDEFEQFFYPISTTSIHLKTSGNEKFSRCENAINNYIKTHHLSTVVLNHAFDSIVWNQYMINTFYKYCLDHHVLPKLARTQCLILIGSIFEVSQVKEKYHLMNELEKRRHTKNSNILLNCCSNDQTFVEQLAQRLIDDDYSVGIDYVDNYNYSENYDCMKSILSLKESATKIIPIFFVKTSFEGQNECLQQLEAEEWFYESFEQNIQFRLTEILNFDYDKLIIELLQYDTKSAIVNGLDSTSDNLENEDDQPKEIPRHFTTEEIAEKERIYEQKIANIFENNRISEDDLKDLIESLEEVLGDSQKTNFEQDKSDFDEFLSSLQRWIDKATNNPVIKGHLPPFTLTGDYNDAIFPILSNDKAPWWDANAHLDEFNHSKPNKYFVFPQPILSCWCNYDETHQYFQQYINREIQFREKKEHERPEDPKNKEHTRSEDPKNEDHHYPHFHTDMKKGIPAWDVTQNPKVIERYEYIEKHYSNPEKLTKYLNRPKDGYNRYLDQLAVLLKGMNEGTIGKNEEQRLTLGNEKKTREELRKLNELDDPNRNWTKRRRMTQKFYKAKIKNIIEWQNFCQNFSK